MWVTISAKFWWLNSFGWYKMMRQFFRSINLSSAEVACQQLFCVWRGVLIFNDTLRPGQFWVGILVWVVVGWTQRMVNVIGIRTGGVLKLKIPRFLFSEWFYVKFVIVKPSACAERHPLDMKKIWKLDVRASLGVPETRASSGFCSAPGPLRNLIHTDKGEH